MEQKFSSNSIDLQVLREFLRAWGWGGVLAQGWSDGARGREHQNGLARDLVLKPVPDAPETFYLYEKVPIRVSALRPNTFIPLALYGSFWWDSNYKICRFCGEKELTEDNVMESEYFRYGTSLMAQFLITAQPFRCLSSPMPLVHPAHGKHAS